MQIRAAMEEDIDQLIRMRYDFTLEYAPDIKADYVSFYSECKAFLENAIIGKRWFIWIAEIDQAVISHIYIQLIDKMPRPGRITYPFGYVTNVYTLPPYRSKGIGSELIKAVEFWAKEHHLEFLIVWPSNEGIKFYERNGYLNTTEPMENYL